MKLATKKCSLDHVVELYERDPNKAPTFPKAYRCSNCHTNFKDQLELTNHWKK